MELNLLTGEIIGAAIKVHKALGPGLLERTYLECLCIELELLGINFEKEKALPIKYEGLKLETAYRIDLLVEGKVIVELKAVETIKEVHKAQTLTYLKLSENEVGLLINFNVSRLKDGIKRFVNNYSESSVTS